MPAFLVPVDSEQCLIPLEKAIVLIGRQSDCDVSLTHSRKISRKHCCIAQVNNKFVVRDLGSTNGVFLNGARIEKEATITIGDDLVIGDVHFRMRNEAPPAPKSAPGNGESKNDRGIKRQGVNLSEAPDANASNPASSPRSRRTVTAPQSSDIPVALPDASLEFVVESTGVSRPNVNRKNRVDDVVPLDDDEEEIDVDVLKLASDSF